MYLYVLNLHDHEPVCDCKKHDDPRIDTLSFSFGARFDLKAPQLANEDCVHLARLNDIVIV